jgi:hypothetical protein
MNRPTAWRHLVIGTIMLLAGGVGPATAATKVDAPIRLIGQPQHDETLDATFSLGMTPDGLAWTQVESGDLTVDKWATAAGDATIVLNYRKDRVTFTLRSGGYTVSRGKRSASFSPHDSNEDRRTAFRTLLIGSPAVRAFRVFTAALERRDGADTTAMISALVDGAIVASLDGDDGAVDRVGRRFARRSRAGQRLAHSAMSAQYEFKDCVGAYERALIFSWDTYASCINPYAFWAYFLFAPVCAIEFGVRSQQYAFQFIACMAIPR